MPVFHFEPQLKQKSGVQLKAEMLRMSGKAGRKERRKVSKGWRCSTGSEGVAEIFNVFLCVCVSLSGVFINQPVGQSVSRRAGVSCSVI